MTDLWKNSETFLSLAALILGSILLGLMIFWVTFKLLEKIAQNDKTNATLLFVKYCRGPSKLLIPLLLIYFGIPFLELDENTAGILRQLQTVLMVVGVSWLIVRFLSVPEELTLKRLKMEETDNLRSRTLETQIKILKKVVTVVIWILALGVTLMTFARVRQLGTSILASAGIAGIIVGVAAQRYIATILAGIQMAVTQPIRLDDVVIIENEWGRIEEITMTYVVVRIWDMRRLIVPITYFFEKPFQNWTRASSEILGTVFFYLDYSVPVDAVRQALCEIVNQAPGWDGKVCSLQVTHAGERTLELRALVSAANSSDAWELRCLVREKIVTFVQENYPEALPLMRAAFRPDSLPERDNGLPENGRDFGN